MTSWLTAAVPMENPYCSRELTREASLESCRNTGYDVERWLEEGLVDLLVPAAANAETSVILLHRPSTFSRVFNRDWGESASRMTELSPTALGPGRERRDGPDHRHRGLATALQTARSPRVPRV